MRFLDSSVTACSLLSLMMLAACGGGGGGSGGGVELQIRTTTLDVFDDLAGVAEYDLNAKGEHLNAEGEQERGYFISPQIVAIANEANGSSFINDDDDEVITNIQNLNNGTVLYEGYDDSDDETILFTQITTDDESTGVEQHVYNSISGSFFVSFGARFGSVPAGVHMYSGTQLSSARIGVSESAYGPFTLTADFSSERYSYNGTSAGTREQHSLSGSGDINIVNGSFYSDNMVFHDGRLNRTATQYGHLHGDQAETVSGLFHTNEANPVYGGGFVGSRP